MNNIYIKYIITSVVFYLLINTLGFVTNWFQVKNILLGAYFEILSLVFGLILGILMLLYQRELPIKNKTLLLLLLLFIIVDYLNGTIFLVLTGLSLTNLESKEKGIPPRK